MLVSAEGRTGPFLNMIFMSSKTFSLSAGNLLVRHELVLEAVPSFTFAIVNEHRLTLRFAFVSYTNLRLR